MRPHASLKNEGLYPWVTLVQPTKIFCCIEYSGNLGIKLKEKSPVNQSSVSFAEADFAAPHASRSLSNTFTGNDHDQQGVVSVQIRIIGVTCCQDHTVFNHDAGRLAALHWELTQTMQVHQESGCHCCLAAPDGGHVIQVQTVLPIRMRNTHCRRSQWSSIHGPDDENLRGAARTHTSSITHYDSSVSTTRSAATEAKPGN